MNINNIGNLFIEELKIHAAPYGLEFPDDVVNRLITRHVAMSENPNLLVEQEEIEFPFNFSNFAIDAQVHPIDGNTIVNVYVKNPHRKHMFGFTFTHKQPHNDTVNLTTIEDNTMKTKITNAGALVKQLEELAVQKSVTIPKTVYSDLIKHCEESMTRGAKGGTKKEFRFNGEISSVCYVLVSEIYPLSKQVYIVLESSAAVHPIFLFDFQLTVEETTDKDINMSNNDTNNNSGNVIKSNSFRAAADMIESIFNMEQWRRDGDVERKMKNLPVGQAIKIMVDDLSHLMLEKVSMDSVEGHKVKADYNGSTLIFLINQDEKEEEYRAPFKGVIGNLRTKLFLNKLKHSSTPIEAFNLVTEWLGEDQEAEGKFSYKDMVVIYSFEYDKHDRSIKASLSIGNKVKCDDCGKAHEMEPIFALTSNFTAENVNKFYNSVKMFAETFLK